MLCANPAFINLLQPTKQVKPTAPTRMAVKAILTLDGLCTCYMSALEGEGSNMLLGRLPQIGNVRGVYVGKDGTNAKQAMAYALAPQGTASPPHSRCWDECMDRWLERDAQETQERPPPSACRECCLPRRYRGTAPPGRCQSSTTIQATTRAQTQQRRKRRRSAWRRRSGRSGGGQLDSVNRIIGAIMNRGLANVHRTKQSSSKSVKEAHSFAAHVWGECELDDGSAIPSWDAAVRAYTAYRLRTVPTTMRRQRRPRPTRSPGATCACLPSSWRRCDGASRRPVSRWKSYVRCIPQVC